MSKTDGGSILLFTDRDSVDIMELKERVYYAEQEEKTDVGKIQYLLSQAGFRTADTEYGAKVLFHVLVPAGEEDAAIKLLTEKTNGKTGITKGELRNETCE